ncbi:hypothetical protein FACS1894132_13190 [Clostridia bacterium]|nr:hypothetical protein FACS1894132_13190 [Clostridia bacterium]
MNKYKNYDFYFTGHSLGGNLAYNGGAKALSIDSGRVKRIVTFNGLGLTKIILPTDLVTSIILINAGNKIINYCVRVEENKLLKLDYVYGLIETEHFGKTYFCEINANAPDRHSLYTFIEKLQ